MSEVSHNETKVHKSCSCFVQTIKDDLKNRQTDAKSCTVYIISKHDENDV